MCNSKIGVIGKEIVNAYHLKLNPQTPVYIGTSNIQHMQESHPDDYKLYGDKIKLILAHPDYVGINPKDKSFEYIKLFNGNIVYVKLAVRKTKRNTYFARSINTYQMKK